MTEEQKPDFLDLSPPDKSAQQANAIAFANKYMIFTSSDDGKDLLAHWEETLMNKRTPIGASINEYAANEALRAFVAGIKAQIKIAQTGRFS